MPAEDTAFETVSIAEVMTEAADVAFDTMTEAMEEPSETTLPIGEGMCETGMAQPPEGTVLTEDAPAV